MDWTTDVNFTRWLLATLSMSLLFFGLWLASKKWGLGGQPTGLRPAKRIKIVESTSLDYKHKAVILQVDDQEFLTLINGQKATQPQLLSPRNQSKKPVVKKQKESA